MEVILLKDIDKLGDKHQLVKVKSGYGRNYLIPQGVALLANESNRKQLAELKKQEEHRENKKLNEYRALADQIKGTTLKIGAKTGTSGKIFGSVTNVQIAQALKEQCNIEVERKKISIPDEVKNVGEYTAVIDFHKEVSVTIPFEVIGE